MRPWPLKPPLALWAFALALLAGCASDPAFQEGERLIRAGQTEAGLKQLEKAVAAQPDNLEYRASFMRNRETRVGQLIAQADAALAAGRLEEAEEGYRQALKLHPENPRAPSGLAAVETARRNQVLLKEAEAAMRKDEPEAARYKLRVVLAQEPGNARAAELLRQADDKLGRTQGVQIPQLSPAFRRAVTLEFRDAPLRTVFDALSRQSGINFVFDKDVRVDQKTTVYARNTAISDAVDMLLATSQLAKKVLNANTLLVYPNQPVKQKEYEELVVRAFFLANMESKGALTMVKTLTKTRDVYVDEKLNLLFVRDTPEAVRLVEKLLAVADQAEPEVMLEVEILEVARSKLLELGVQWPSQLTLLGKERSETAIFDPQGNLIGTDVKFIDVPLTLNSLKGLGPADADIIGISPTPGAIARQDQSFVNLLANPRIRVRNKEKAKIHIGDKVPVITSNVTSTGVTSESVSYLDVGLKLDVEPQVYLQGEVAMKVGLEVSNIVREVKSANGTLTYQLGSRNATTVLRLKDGETQVLAGLISDEDREGAAGLPGLTDLPLLGRLFSSKRDETKKTEIVLLIKPRILRNLERPDLSRAEFFAGTEGSVSDRPLVLRPSPGLPAAPPRRPILSPAPGAAPEVPPQEVEQALDAELPAEAEPPPAAQ